MPPRRVATPPCVRDGVRVVFLRETVENDCLRDPLATSATCEDELAEFEVELDVDSV